ncbi:biotin synthase BioB [Methanocaldococcus infernus]
MDFEKALELYENSSTIELLYKALKFRKKDISLCSIINAKSGKCKEDCIFCSQSIYHKTNIQVYPFLPKEEILEKINHLSKFSDRVGIVVSGKKIEDEEFEKLLEVLEEVDTKVCCSLGLIEKEKLKELKKFDVRIHCNIETNREYFKNICSTHSYEDKIRVIKEAKKLGLEVCSGGIFGLGESYRDRIKMALELKELKVDSVPINIIHPIEGTKIYNLIKEGKVKKLEIDEILKSIAIFKIILKDAEIRIAGGRKFLKEFQALALMALDGVMIGNYLTTEGRDIKEDLEMINNFLKIIS